MTPKLVILQREEAEGQKEVGISFMLDLCNASSTCMIRRPDLPPFE